MGGVDAGRAGGGGRSTPSVRPSSSTSSREGPHARAWPAARTRCLLGSGLRPALRAEPLCGWRGHPSGRGALYDNVPTVTTIHYGHSNELSGSFNLWCARFVSSFLACAAWRLALCARVAFLRIFFSLKSHNRYHTALGADH